MEQRIKEALAAIEDVMKMAYNNAYPECCGQGKHECCGNFYPAWDQEDQEIMDRLAPVRDFLISLLAAQEK